MKTKRKVLGRAVIQVGNRWNACGCLFITAVAGTAHESGRRWAGSAGGWGGTFHVSHMFLIFRFLPHSSPSSSAYPLWISTFSRILERGLKEICENCENPLRNGILCVCTHMFVISTICPRVERGEMKWNFPSAVGAGVCVCVRMRSALDMKLLEALIYSIPPHRGQRPQARSALSLWPLSTVKTTRRMTWKALIELFFRNDMSLRDNFASQEHLLSSLKFFIFFLHPHSNILCFHRRSWMEKLLLCQSTCVKRKKISERERERHWGMLRWQ